MKFLINGILASLTFSNLIFAHEGGWTSGGGDHADPWTSSAWFVKSNNTSIHKRYAL